MVHDLKFELLDYVIWGGRCGGGGKVAGSGGGKVLLGMTCQVDHFGSIEEEEMEKQVNDGTFDFR